jgi:CBS-domain-containing membrane protein
MRKSNCGALPVVDSDEKVIGMITDRDICLAMGQKDHDPSRTTVSEVISGEVYDCAPGDGVKNALKTMRKKKVKRLPVVKGAGALKGILSFGDILLHARKAKSKKSQKPSYKDLARTLRAICEPRAPKLAKSQPRNKAVTVAVK